MHRIVFGVMILLIHSVTWWKLHTGSLQSSKTVAYAVERKLANATNSAHSNPRHRRLYRPTCLSQGLQQYPPEGSLERRMPHAIIMGSMKSGTSALSSYLYQHPHVVRPKNKELHFFDFKYKDEGDIPRSTTRRHLRKEIRKVLGADAKETLKNNPKAVAIDDSPRYIFLSHQIPDRILCVCPWAKILAILRNPVDRAYSQYNMFVYFEENKTMLPTFEEWIEEDLKHLKETGVLQSNQDNQDSVESLKAWQEYTQRGGRWPLGRGLYAIQLRQWFQAYEDFGKSREDFMVVQSEYMKTNTSGVYKEVLQFLGLEQFELESEKKVYDLPYNAPMKNETRAMLEKFFKPYNRQLYGLLGDKWEGIWDP